jgi:hypothetical protein
MGSWLPNIQTEFYHLAFGQKCSESKMVHENIILNHGTFAHDSNLIQSPDDPLKI